MPDISSHVMDWHILIALSINLVLMWHVNNAHEQIRYRYRCGEAILSAQWTNNSSLSMIWHPEEEVPRAYHQNLCARLRQIHRNSARRPRSNSAGRRVSRESGTFRAF